MHSLHLKLFGVLDPFASFTQSSLNNLFPYLCIQAFLTFKSFVLIQSALMAIVTTSFFFLTAELFNLPQISSQK